MVNMRVYYMYKLFSYLMPPIFLVSIRKSPFGPIVSLGSFFDLAFG